MKKKKFGAHTHFTQHMTTKCCNITTTVNNASTNPNHTTKKIKTCCYNALLIAQLYNTKVNMLKMKKNSEHTHTSQLTSRLKCCNITTTVNNAANSKLHTNILKMQRDFRISFKYVVCGVDKI